MDASAAPPRRRCFAQWAGTREETVTAKEETFAVINDILQSRSRGIRFRNSPKLADKNRTKIASFGSTVKGFRQGADWVKVGDLYLPMTVGGKYVLLRQEGEDADDFGDARLRWWSQQGQEDRLRNAHPVLADHIRTKLRLERDRAQAGQQANGISSGTTVPGGIEHAEAAFWYDASGGQFLVPEKGTGAMYQVMVDKVEVHQAPEMSWQVENDGETDGGARFIHAHAVAELFHWDKTRRFRFCRHDDLGMLLCGWVRLDSSSGPLLRPTGWLSRRDPLEPVAAAAHEDNLVHLKRCIADGLALDKQDENGLTPLMVASIGAQFDGCVLLLHAGADASLRNKSLKRARDLAPSAPLRALLDALSGEEVFDMRDFEVALEQLLPEFQDLAEGVLDRIARASEARRREEQERGGLRRFTADREVEGVREATDDAEDASRREVDVDTFEMAQLRREYQAEVERKARDARAERDSREQDEILRREVHMQQRKDMQDLAHDADLRELEALLRSQQSGSASQGGERRRARWSWQAKQSRGQEESAALDCPE